MKTKPTLKDWIIATRPWSFTVSALPAVIAMLYAMHMYPESISNWWMGVIAIVGAVVFHAGGNLLSDYNDYSHGVDNEDSISVTTLTSGLFSAKQIFTYGCIFIAIGIAIGFYLVSLVGFELVVIGIVGTIGAIFYYKFKYSALGDFLIFLVYGPTIMIGTGFVMLGYIDWTLICVSFPIVFITVNVLHSNNTRDMLTDKLAKIKTYAMVIGVRASIRHYIILTILSYISVVVMIIFGILPLTSLITFLTIPIAVKNCRAMSRITEEDKTSINNLDQNTAKLQLMFSTLLSLALIISIVI